MRLSSAQLFEVTSCTSSRLRCGVTLEVELSHGEVSVVGIGPWDATPSRGNPTERVWSAPQLGRGG